MPNRFLTSVYGIEVAADNPVIWFRFNDGLHGAETALTAKNSGSGDFSGTYVGAPKINGPSMIVGDNEAKSIDSINQGLFAGVAAQYVTVAGTDFKLTQQSSWAVEFWFRRQLEEASSTLLYEQITSSPTFNTALISMATATQLRFLCENSAGAQFFVESASDAIAANVRYHVVAKFVGGTMTLWIDGVQVGTPATFTGKFDPAVTALDFGSNRNFTDRNASGQLGEFAVYVGDGGADPLPEDRIVAHFAAGVAPWDGDTPGARINRVLDFLGWPAADRDVDDGESLLQSADILGQSAGDHMRLVALTEYGELFVTPAGKFRFISRKNRWKPPYNVPIGTFSDDGADIGYSQLRFNYDDQLIRNKVTIGYSNGISYTANSTSSQDDFFIHEYQQGGLIGDDDSEAVDYANYIVNRYDEPLLRVQNISFFPQADPTNLFPVALAADLVYQVNVERTPQSIGTAIDLTYTIEGVSHHIEPKFWRTELQLSPADTPGSFILNSTSQGVLDTNTLGF